MASTGEFLNLKKKEKLLKKAAEILSVNDVDLPRVVERFLKDIEEMNKKLNL
ncbi:MAG: hypothetical protein HY361_00195 [Candidatus Aenigmarchaeota archaeon]|nr:hypothetical protein [Candidatus Aenigmarchaeota archaeon]